MSDLQRHGNAFSPLGERVAHGGALTSRRGPGEGAMVLHPYGGKPPRLRGGDNGYSTMPMPL